MLSAAKCGMHKSIKLNYLNISTFKNKLKPTARVSTDPTCSIAENKATTDTGDEEITEPIPTNEDTNQKGQLKVSLRTQET